MLDTLSPSLLGGNLDLVVFPLFFLLMLVLSMFFRVTSVIEFAYCLNTLDGSICSSVDQEPHYMNVRGVSKKKEKLIVRDT